MLCLTNPNYNLASKYFVGLDESYVEFTEDYKVHIKRGKLAGRFIEPSQGIVRAAKGNVERPAQDIALVSRITEQAKGRRIVYAAGAGSNGSRAALLYLMKHWRDLDKQFGTTDFAIVLECPNRRKDPEGYKLARTLQILPIETN